MSDRYKDTCFMEWILDFEGEYAIDEYGVVTSFKNKKCKELGIYVNTWGYPHVSLYKDGKRYVKRVHRLVAETFLKNEMNLPEVNHKDGDKLNTRVSNLEWITKSDNMKHAHSIGLHPKHKDKLCKDGVVQSKQGDIVYFTSQKDFCNENGLAEGNFSRMLQGIYKSCKGWTLCT